MTNKNKLATFDAVVAERDKLSLALYDLVNGKWGLGKREHMTEYQKDMVGLSLLVRMSWRAMPLFLVVSSGADGRKSPTVYTDDEIQDGYRQNPTYPWWRAIMHARNELVSKQLGAAA